MKQRLSAGEIAAFLDEVFPGAMDRFVIEDVQPMHAVRRTVFNQFNSGRAGPSAGRR